MEKLYKHIFILLFLIFGNSYGQESRLFEYNQTQVEYITYFNTLNKVTPNLNANIILVDDTTDLKESFEEDSIKNSIVEMSSDFGVYYYIKIPKENLENNYINFLKAFVFKSHSLDYFDRNKTHLYLKSNDISFSCDSLKKVNEVFATLWISDNSPMMICDNYFICDIAKNENLKVKKRNLKTTVNYNRLNLTEITKKKEKKDLKKELKEWKHNFFIALKIGNQQISNKFKTSFDQETLIDFSELNTFWSIQFGYMFTNHFGGLINFGLIYKKEESSKNFQNTYDGAIISGSGSAAGLFKTGLGFRYVPFIKNEWSIYTDAAGGFINAKAGGGSGDVTISYGNVTSTIEKVEKSEKAKYIDFSIGTNYRLGNVVYLNGNFQYSFSKFDNPIGSISGHTGLTINIGLGFTFK